MQESNLYEIGYDDRWFYGQETEFEFIGLMSV